MTQIPPNLTHLIALAQDAAGVSKSAAQVATENIAGTRDPGYVKRSPTTDIDIVNGRVSGIRTGLPQRVVDEKIVAAKRDQNSGVEFNRLKQEFLELLDDMNGDLESDRSLSHRLLNFSQKAASLTADANNTVLRRNVVEALKDFTGMVNAFAKGISDQRNMAEQGVSDTVKAINVLTERLYRLNEEITIGVHREQDMTALETKRENIIESLAKLTNVKVVRSEANLFVYTDSGKPLVEYKHYPMKYTSSGIVDYSSEYPTNINPVTVKNDQGNYENITLELSGGRIGAYLHVRDKVYPDYQKTLDKFTQKFQEHVNHIHNKGTGFPPPSQLTGRHFIEAADRNTAIDWQPNATVRIAITDETGKFADAGGGGGAFYVDLDLNPSGTGLSPLEIRDQVNAALGVEVITFSDSLSASALDNYGHLSISAPPGLKVAIGEVSGQPAATTNGGVGFSEYFHLNDLLVSTPNDDGAGYANSLAVREEIAIDQSLLSVAQLNNRTDISLAGTAEQTMGITAGDGRNLVSLRDRLNDSSILFDAAGRMPQNTTSFLSYVKDMVNIINLDASAAISDSRFSEDVLEGLEQRHALLSGVTQDEEIGEVMAQKLFYKGIMATSQHLIDMLNALLDLFGHA